MIIGNPITLGGATATSLILVPAAWQHYSQTVNVSGVTASNNVVVSPNPASILTYANCGVYCSEQADGTLTFRWRRAKPTSAITVNVLIVR